MNSNSSNNSNNNNNNNNKNNDNTNNIQQNGKNNENNHQIISKSKIEFNEKNKNEKFHEIVNENENEIFNAPSSSSGSRSPTTEEQNLSKKDDLTDFVRTENLMAFEIKNFSYNFPLKIILFHYLNYYFFLLHSLFCSKRK